MKEISGKAINKISPQGILLFFSISFYCLSTLPRILSYGMFFDGVTYSCIARNIAEGYGSFWHLYYTDIVYKVFYEQPPLTFWIQSFFFKIFGNGLWIEYFYGWLCGLMTIILIILIWNRIKKSYNILTGSWLPVLLFVSFPQISWAYANNMLENTMTVFVMLSALFSILSITTERSDKTFYYGFLSGLFIFASFLSKGPSGVFPLIIPFLWWIVYKDVSFQKVIFSFLSILGGLLLSASIIILPNKDALSFLENYFNTQVLNTLLGKRETGSHFAHVEKWFMESLVPLFICLLIFLIKRKRLSFKNNKSLIFFLILSLSGFLPLLLSPKQMGWYQIPSYPFFAMFFASAFLNSSREIEEKINKTARYIMIYLSFAVLTASIVLMFLESGKVRKEKDFHKDFSIQKIEIPERIVISVFPAEMEHSWGLVANMERQFKVSLSSEFGKKYLLTTKEHSDKDTITRYYKKIHPPEPSNYLLFEKKEEK